jgi:UDP-galactopyranose mutase
MKFDYVIVGAGISGCVCAEQLAQQESKQILIIEKRNHIAGNCYDFRDENNILIHKYGPHIFHTNNNNVWKYLSNFTDWELYQHRVLGLIDGMNVPIPFNLNSIHKCFSANLANKIETELLEKFEYGEKIPILKLRQENSPLLKMLADYIYEKVFLGYTIKQWGMEPEELAWSVTSRIPVFISNDDRYFQDKYQGIPKLGYTKLVENLIDRPNIHLLLNTDFNKIKDELEYERLIYTGMIDEFFEYEFGKLPYRSLRFDFEKFDLPNEQRYFQPVSQMNYPSNYDYTRITEFSHFFKNKNFYNKTVIAKEYPMPYTHCPNEIPYYPIPQKQNSKIYDKYVALTKGTEYIIFLGRLADYSYYNMDQAIARALKVSSKLLM